MALFTSSSLFDFIILIFVMIGLGYYAFQRRYSYWRDKGVFSPTPSIPFGNTKNTILGRRPLGLEFQRFYNDYKEKPYLGVFMMHRPTFVINDLDFIKTILTKDFVHFSDHGLTFNEEVEPLTGHLFNIGGEKWKNLRVKLTPTFTSSKIKNMFEVVAACATEIEEYLDNHISKNQIDDAKEIMAKFSTDVIASCAFGVECKSFKNPDDMFRKMGKRLFNPSAFEYVLNAIDFFIPNSITNIKVKLIGKEMEEFFLGLVESTVKHREENGIVRNDFMQLLIQLKNTGCVSEDKSDAVHDDGTRLTLMQLAAQVFVFFVAGFETSSSTASFTLYELARNPDIQSILVQEIDEILEKHGGKVTYDSLTEMNYLTKCIEETLRKYPPLPVVFRVCTKDYIIPGTEIKIEKNTTVLVPVYGIQRDPEIYPKPDTFDPERFSPENKAARHHFSYLPFGEGPRICIGSRFGMMEIKLAIVTVLSKYKVDVCEKTQIPMEYDKRSFILQSDGGVWLKFVKRNK